MEFASGGKLRLNDADIARFNFISPQ